MQEDKKDLPIEEKVYALLKDKKYTISCAESCTGGLISATLVNVSGISEVFKEGIVTYSNDAKKEYLGVKKKTLKKYGAVSKQTAKEMAVGIAGRAKSDVAISTTGIAGPDGGSEDKPVGLVYIGIYINGETFVKEYVFEGDRQSVRMQATLKALHLLKKRLKNKTI